jgi:host factor-I protein
MTNRRLIRPDAGDMKKEASSRAVRRKQTPPEQTNAEEFYYLKQMAARTPMVVILSNDEELRGWIEWYDKGSIKLNRTSGPNLLITKHSIRYMFKEEELKVRRRSKKDDGPAEGESAESHG